MTNESIKKILDRINSGKHDDVIIAPISNDVWWGYVWGETEQGYEPEGFIQEKGHEFYFVKAKDGKFAAAVFRMGMSEIHWFVGEKYRRKGLLVEPLRKTILPFIFSVHANIDQQEANIERGADAKYSAKLARKIGFCCVSTKDGDKKFVIRRKNVVKFVSSRRLQPKETEFKALKRQMQIAVRTSGMVLDRLRVQHAKDLEDIPVKEFEECLNELFYRVTNYADARLSC